MLNILDLMNREIEKGTTKLKNLDESYASLKQDKEDEIKVARSDISRKYAMSMEKNRAAATQAFEYRRKLSEMLVKKSEFNAKKIGSMLSDIVTFFEGMPFHYRHFSFNEFIRWNGMTLEKEMHVICSDDAWEILREVLDQKTYDEEDGLASLILQDLIEQRELIILDQSYEKKDKIRFVKQGNDDTLDSAIDFSQFDYLDEFMDEVMQYKLEKDLEDVTFTDLKEMQIEFLRNNRDYIECLYIRRQEEERDKLIDISVRRRVQGRTFEQFQKFLGE